ncbi:MAG: DHHA1 domain-containing protein [Nanoarchaeota archaeon]
MEDQIRTIQEKLLAAKNPLFLFDDDCDGLTSFLQLYRFVGRGKGVIVKSSPELSVEYVRRVAENAPDLVVILDKPVVQQQFLDSVSEFGIEVIWIDHHPPQVREKVIYFNPRLFNEEDNRPTAYWAWRISHGLIWVAMLGAVSDWHLLEDLRKPFAEKYPDLLPEQVKTPEEALFQTRLGQLIKVCSFNLKGRLSEVNTSIRILTRIEDPFEILEQKTPRGKLLYRKYEKMNVLYEELLSKIEVSEKKIIFYTYKDNKTAMTSELSNELLYRHPGKVIFIAREKSGEMKCSIRSAQYVIPPLLKEALIGIEGYGGGHDHACGACIKKRQFKEFFRRFSALVDAAG